MAERAASVGDFEESFAIIQSLPPEDAVNSPSSIKGTSKSLALIFYMHRFLYKSNLNFEGAAHVA